MTENLTKKVKMLAEAVMGNDDLLLEIILRLPAVSLYRFKCVSKHWQSLISSFISNPKSCSAHTQKNHKSSIFGVYFYFNLSLAEDLELKSVSLCRAGQNLPTLEFLDLANNVESLVLHASNGLFLCSIGDEKPFAICNLTTQKFHLLPQHLPFSPFEGFDEGSAHLVFNPAKSIHYKVVLVHWLVGDGTFEYYRDEEREKEYNELDGPWYEIDIYTSETKTWKRKHLHASFGFQSEYKVLWNGVVHWMNDGFHVRFEINTETINASPLQPDIKTDQIRYFGECCGYLYLIQIERRDCQKVHVLEMHDDFSWTEIYALDMMPIQNTFDEIFKSPDPINYGYEGEDFESWKFSVLHIIKEDKNNDDMRLLLALPGKIILTGPTKELCDFPPSDFFLMYPYNHAIAFEFIPTLYPV